LYLIKINQENLRVVVYIYIYILKLLLVLESNADVKRQNHLHTTKLFIKKKDKS
jgi:hypothetical protein